MKIYIASNFGHRYSIKRWIPKLQEMGHEVTSSWITDDSHTDSKNKVESAQIDIVDIAQADAILYLNEAYCGAIGRGKHFELGYALAKGKKCFSMGQNKRMIFLNLPEIIHITKLEEIK